MIDWSISLKQRADYYAQRFPDWPAPRADDRWIDGVWVLGNNYKGAPMYGTYPPNYLARALSLFPEATSVLHLFSGTMVRPLGWPPVWVSMDLRRTPPVSPLVQGDATRAPFAPGSFDLVVADPPYSAEDATRYGTPMVDRAKVFRDAYRYVQPGGVMIWLDCSHPMRRKDQWHFFGVFGIVRSTNHRYRAATFYRREP